MSKLHIRKDDTVVVLAGADKGKTGKVLKVLVDENRAIVEGVNMVKKALKPSQANPEGGIVEKDAKIDVSNVMAYDKKAKAASRIGIKFDENGNKQRYYKKSGTVVKEEKK